MGSKIITIDDFVSVEQGKELLGTNMDLFERSSDAGAKQKDGQSQNHPPKPHKMLGHAVCQHSVRVRVVAMVVLTLIVPSDVRCPLQARLHESFRSRGPRKMPGATMLNAKTTT